MGFAAHVRQIDTGRFDAASGATPDITNPAL
jgi:hypothetical protein